MKEKRTIYFEDELSDEFSGSHINAIKIDGKYKYHSNSFFYKLAHFFYYRIIATPIAYCFLKLKFHLKIHKPKGMRKFIKGGYFLFGNHTQIVSDALIPTMITTPDDAYVIVHPDNVSMPVLGRINRYLGAIPLPDDFEASKHFVSAIETRLKENNVIVVYPEAHIWPYYTKIRPFSDKSFRYPVNTKRPSFSFVNVYKKRKHGNGVTIETFVDGPFFPDESLSIAERKKKLRNEVYDAMVKRSEQSNYEFIKYVKKEKSTDD